MIRLSLPKKPYWIALPHDVRVFVNPLSTAIYEAARAKASRTVGETFGQMAELRELGGHVEGIPDLSDPDAATGFSQLVFAQAIAASAIIKWEGVLDADGVTPARVTAETVSELMMIHRMAEAFVVQYTRTHEELISEGNASAPSPNGTSEGGANSATIAGASEPLAQAAV